MTRILQVSDLHIMPEGQLFHGQIDTAQALREMLSGLAGLLPAIGPVERIVLSGDLTETGCVDAYAMLQAIMAECPLPWRVIPGNHDSREGVRALAADALSMPATGPINWREDVGDVTLLGVDTLVEGAAHGTLAAESLDWLSSTLRGLQGRQVLLFMHHPPCTTGIAAMDDIGLLNHSELAEIVVAHAGPLQIACGHVHRMMIGQFAGRQVVIAPGTSHAVILDMRARMEFGFIPGHRGAVLHSFGDHCQSALISSADFADPFPFS
ncbi:metallophosphoesterase [Anianabacter salinae]|uniref:metallophosphoesterase n=1 Tax=Anianabacter salinae TaxID=2851023 RepID=UPI00225E01A1|nr:metallophosphoesterase [Anianabacter salinae]MBV0913775.1 metallophosphoesterase [Anianabacter salinae]